MHTIDLKNYSIRTDLAIEAISNQKNISKKIRNIEDITVTNIMLTKEQGKMIHKKEGFYTTIEFVDITDYEKREKVKETFIEELKKLFEKCSIKEDDTCFVLGLGNKNSTPDALGPMSIDNIIVTNHLFQLGSVENGFRPVCALAPGVMGTTGIETLELLKSIVNTVKPNFVIAIDALASQSVERLNKTIQMTNTGIHPGSGIGNNRKEISFETLKIPVIAIGVPTVVDAVTIVSDTIRYMYKHVSYMKENMNKPINKLIGIQNINYLKEETNLKKEDKETLLGVVGSLKDEEVKQWIFEVLSPIGYNLMVTPKEVDFLMEKLSDVIGNGINHVLHKKVNKN